MSSFLRKSILFGCFSVRISPPSLVGNPNVFSVRWFSNDSNQQSFTVNYLINELGFSPKTALTVSKYANFETSEKPEKVINLFKKYGFSQTQISSIVRRSPQLFSMDLEKTLLPKFEFFGDKGVSWPQFAKNLTIFPSVLRSSLKNQIVPSYEFFRKFFQSDARAIATVERYPDILVINIEKYVVSKIDVLREHGVPDSNIAKLLPSQPRAFSSSSDRFQEAVEKVAEIGLNPEKLNFVYAVLALCCLSKSTWENKVNAFKRCGWSEEEVYKAFERHPWCLTLSEDKIFAGMDFFMNNMGLSPCVIAKNPVILSLSLKKRVIPRFSVFQALLSKSLMKKEVSLHLLFMVPENKFLQHFVVPHEKEAPELLKLYKEKLDLSNGPEIKDKVC